MPQAYTLSTFDPSTRNCSSLTRPQFIYSRHLQGAIWGGSSGAPVAYAEAGDVYVVGQLYGTCRAAGSADCDPATESVDGAFATTYPSIVQWIRPGSGVQPACSPSPTTLCLSGNRFAVTASWKSSSGQGTATAVSMTGDTGYLWFFQSSNVEVVVKVLNGCSINSRFWVFAGGLTNVQVTLSVTDTRTGSVKTYTNPQNTAFQPIQDTSAFSTCP